MKKLTFIFTILLLISLGISELSYAQKKEMTKDQIPSQIITAIQSDFPSWDMNNTKWYVDSKDIQEWAPLDENIDRYIVEATGKNYKTHAVYDNKGKLRYSKTTMKDIPLPKAIRDKLASDDEFAGWQLTGNQEVIRNFKADRKTYTLHLEKDGKKKTVHFNRMGEKVKRLNLG